MATDGRVLIRVSSLPCLLESLFLTFPQSSHRGKGILFRLLLNNFELGLLGLLLLLCFWLSQVLRLGEEGAELLYLFVPGVQVPCVASHRLVYHFLEADDLVPHRVLQLLALLQLAVQHCLFLGLPVGQGTDPAQPLSQAGHHSVLEALEVLRQDQQLPPKDSQVLKKGRRDQWIRLVAWVLQFEGCSAHNVRFIMRIVCDSRSR